MYTSKIKGGSHPIFHVVSKDANNQDYHGILVGGPHRGSWELTPYDELVMEELTSHLDFDKQTQEWLIK